VIGYDGSQQAAAAIDQAGALLPGTRALVVTVWKPISEILLAVSLGPAPLISDPADLDERQRRGAETVARDGVKRAERAGLQAEPLVVRARGPIWQVLDDVAREHDGRVIACGSERGPGVETMLQSRVAVALLHHASRPVLVVPTDTDEP
jgi:nucleotide-binding universal stress UspA family protein